PMIADPPHWTWVELKLGVVPQTLLVSRDGIVRDVHIGEIDPAAERALAAAISGLARRDSDQERR
ncbi:MAG TPA: hypothetical protein VMK16_19850, partial [Acidimicrobiales bacterium]|nr:hypothetical protein [Acidimicrobiales bacterium]